MNNINSELITLINAGAYGYAPIFFEGAEISLPKNISTAPEKNCYAVPVKIPYFGHFISSHWT